MTPGTHPILFSGEMVRAILAGRKTQTRRPVKLAPPWEIDERDGAPWPRNWQWSQGDARSEWMRSPYRVGDRLYVRESYAPHYHGPGRHGYAADWTERAADTVPRPRWTPSIHMRKAAARIWLEVVGVRVERVRDISCADSLAEGMTTPRGGCIDGLHARAEFGRLWIDIYGADSWGLGYCWVYDFRRVEVAP